MKIKLKDSAIGKEPDNAESFLAHIFGDYVTMRLDTLNRLRGELTSALKKDMRDHLLNEALSCIEIYNKSIDPVGLYQDADFVKKMKKIEDNIKIYYGRYGV